MDTVMQPIFYLMVILLALIIRGKAQRSFLSYPVILIILGFVISEVVIFFGVDTGIRVEHFQRWIMYLFLPVIVFCTAYSLPLKDVLGNFKLLGILIIIGMPICFAITTIVIYYGIGHPQGFPLQAAMLTAAILSGTGVTAVLQVLPFYQGTERVQHVLKTEGLLSCVITIVLFNVMLYMATQQADQNIAASDWFLEFLEVIFGGLFMGILVGGLSLGLLVFNRDRLIQSFVIISSVYISYWLAKDVMHASGVIAVATVGFVLSALGKYYESVETDNFIEQLWHLLFLIAYTSVFLLVGVATTLSMFSERWLAMLFGIIAIVLARVVLCYGVLPIFGGFNNNRLIAKREMHLLAIGGTRGVVALALALSIPIQLKYWWTVQSIVFGVVLFNLLIQLPIVNIYGRR